MITVDSSVWIDYFTGTNNKSTNTLHNILGLKPMAVRDLILTEVLQGSRYDRDFKPFVKHLGLVDA